MRKSLHYGRTKPIGLSSRCGRVGISSISRRRGAAVAAVDQHHAGFGYGNEIDNPDLRILFSTGGYFDLATPYYEGWYEMHHLPSRERLQDHIEYHYYQSGHMGARRSGIA